MIPVVRLCAWSLFLLEFSLFYNFILAWNVICCSFQTVRLINGNFFSFNVEDLSNLVTLDVDENLRFITELPNFGGSSLIVDKLMWAWYHF